jgi:serine/threonine protein phosphatase PrpC
MPCQDAYALWSGAVAGLPCLVAAVADGHGDARHDRSQYGATLAAQAAVDVVREFCLAHSQEEALIALKHDFKTHLPRKVGQRWREAVRDDAQTQDDAIFTRYGTTLLVALAVPEAVLIGQIGDGALLWVTDNTCEVLLHPAPTLLGTETHSLRSPDAPQLWQTAVFERTAAGLVLLTTDGLSDALSDEPTALEPFARSLCQRLQDFGPVQVASALPTWLDYYSAHGSGDDITLALLWLEAPAAGSMATATSHPSEETVHEPEHRPAGDGGSAAEHTDRHAETR